MLPCGRMAIKTIALSASTRTNATTPKATTRSLMVYRGCPEAAHRVGTRNPSTDQGKCEHTKRKCVSPTIRTQPPERRLTMHRVGLVATYFGCTVLNVITSTCGHWSVRPPERTNANSPLVGVLRCCIVADPHVHSPSMCTVPHTRRKFPNADFFPSHERGGFWEESRQKTVP